MRISTLATTIALATIAIIGSVSASDQLTTMKGIEAVPMSALELSAVKGMDHHFFILASPDNPNAIFINIGNAANPNFQWVLDPNNSANAAPMATAGRFMTDWNMDASSGNFVFIDFNGTLRLVSPAYHGLMNACGNGTIEGPNFLC